MKINIIDVSGQRPKWQVIGERMLAVLLTAALWAVLLYGIGSELLGQKGKQSLEMLSFLLGISLLIFAIFASWQYYNWHRFHGKERRKAFKPQPLSEVAALYGMTEAEMREMQKPARQVEFFYEDGHYYYQIPHQRRIEIRKLRER